LYNRDVLSTVNNELQQAKGHLCLQDEKQAIFVQEVGDWLEDNLRTKLETVVGLFPAGLKEVIKAGEKLLEDSLHLLNIADLYGWPAVA
jgi:hypothetical protein